MSELNNVIKETINELFSMFGIESNVKNEIEEDKLKSSQEINIILGLTGDVKGSLLLGANKKIVLKIVSAMMGGMEFPEVDDIVISGISEFTNMAGGTAATKLHNQNKSIDISPPTVVKSDNGSTIVFNSLKTHKVVYEVAGEEMTVSCCLKD